jgi:hypothetical protein
MTDISDDELQKKRAAEAAKIPSDKLQESYATEAANIPKFGEKISELCKYVWAGSLAIAYAIATNDKPNALFSGNQKYILIAAAGAGSLALLFDYLQYLAAFLHAKRIVQWIESAPKPVAQKAYNDQTVSIYSQANAFFFFAKNVAVFVSAALIALAMICAIFA